MNLFFATNLRHRTVLVVPWTSFADRIYFIVRVNDGQAKYAPFEVGSTAPEIFARLDEIFPGLTTLESIYQSPVLESNSEVVVWVRLAASLDLPSFTRRVTFRNFKSLIKASIPGLDPRLKTLMTRSSPREAHTRLSGVRKGIQTVTKAI